MPYPTQKFSGPRYPLQSFCFSLAVPHAKNKKDFRYYRLSGIPHVPKNILNNGKPPFFLQASRAPLPKIMQSTISTQPKKIYICNL